MGAVYWQASASIVYQNHSVRAKERHHTTGENGKKNQPSFPSGMESANRRLRCLERTDGAAMFEICQPFIQAFLDKLLRREHQLVPPQFDGNVISHRQSQLVMEPFRNHHLPADADFHHRHQIFSYKLFFHIFVYLYFHHTPSPQTSQESSCFLVERRTYMAS